MSHRDPQTSRVAELAFLGVALAIAVALFVLGWVWW